MNVRRRTGQNRITVRAELADTRRPTRAHRVQGERPAAAEGHMVQGWPLDRPQSQQVPVRVFQVCPRTHKYGCGVFTLVSAI